MTRKELSEMVAEAAARTERAAARIETTRAEMGVWRAQNEKVIGAARAKQEEARASQEATRAELESSGPFGKRNELNFARTSRSPDERPTRSWPN
jgi:hypothetical protein